MRRDRSIFGYMEPSSDGKEFAQCATCQLYIEPKERCYWLQGGFRVTADDSCDLYVEGTPVNYDLATTNSLTPKEAGFVRGKVRCENCVSFDGRGKCLLFEKLNNSYPDIFDLDTKVKLKGCCNAFARKAKQRADGGRVDTDIKIDTTKDVRWMSEMSKDGDVFYRDRSLPDRIINNKKWLVVNEPLKRHEIAEYSAIKKAIADFEAKLGRKPNDAEREEIYLKCHKEHGEVAEHDWLRANGYDVKAWEAWCRGKLAYLEHKRIAKPVPNPHVRVSPHDRRKLETTL